MTSTEMTPTTSAELTPISGAVSRVEEFPIAWISEDPMNPRKTFAEADIVELAQDIAAHGVLQPILIRPNRFDGSSERAGRYKIVFGARRFRAAQRAGLDTLPAMVRELDDREALELMIVENTQRADIHPLEEAEGYMSLHETHNYSTEDIAAKVGKSKAYVYARMKLCALAPAAKKAFLAGELTPSTALLVARIPEKLQASATKDLIYEWGTTKHTSPLSYRDASALVQREYMLRLSEAPFPTSDPQLKPNAGPCTTCPKRTGNQRELFDDVKSADVCTDPVCFKSKGDAQWARIKVDAAAMGYAAVLTDKAAKAVFPPNFHGSGTAYKSGYVGLEESASGVPYNSKENGKKYNQLLKEPIRKGELDLIVARDNEGRIRKLLREKDARKALKDAGLLKTAKSEPSGYSIQERKRQKAAATMKRAARKAVEKMVELAERSADGADAGFWRLLAELIDSSIGSLATTAVEKRRGVKSSLSRAIAAADAPTARGIAVELLLESQVDRISSWSSPPFPTKLAAAAKHFGVDLKTAHAEAKAEEKKPARKKATKRRAVKK